MTDLKALSEAATQGKFVKKPVQIEAVQLTARTISQAYEFMHGPQDVSAQNGYYWDQYCEVVVRDGMTVTTLEDGSDGRAKHVATIGDWIIKGIQGEFYPCKPDIFEASYTRSDQLVEAPVWQDIETAPKDGTPVDLLSKVAGRVIDAEWCWSSPTHPNGHWCRDILNPCNTDLSWIDPTHWMPIPTPPTEEAET